MLRSAQTCFLLAFTTGLLFPASGCRQIGHDPVVWKTEVRSPDGTWIATARTDQWGGFGTARVETTVSIRKVDGTVNHGEPFGILSFPDGGGISKAYTLSDDNADRSLDVRWTSPKHLEITHTSAINPDLEVVRFSDVDITYDLAR